MAQHDPWLEWKRRRGLAVRGRGKMQPRGLLANILYKLYYKRHDTEPPANEPQVNKITVGGTLGPRGKVNGE